MLQQVTTNQEALEEIWRSVESNITVHIHLQKHRERAAEVSTSLQHRFLKYRLNYGNT